MSKIYEVILKMIANHNKITDVSVNDDDEIFFLYNGKYTWSVLISSNGKYSIYFYPDHSPDELVDVSDWEGVKMVAYTHKEIPEEDAQRRLKELCQLLKSKVISEADLVLDDILADD